LQVSTVAQRVSNQLLEICRLLNYLLFAYNIIVTAHSDIFSLFRSLSRHWHSFATIRYRDGADLEETYIYNILLWDIK
jgi:hypothetical protein